MCNLNAAFLKLEDMRDDLVQGILTQKYEDALIALQDKNDASHFMSILDIRCDSKDEQKAIKQLIANEFDNFSDFKSMRSKLSEKEDEMTQVTLDGLTVTLKQNAYLDVLKIYNFEDRLVYRASATDSNGNDYRVIWEIHDDYNPENEEECACNWDKPSSIELI
jgi:hypothetical protein